MVFITVDVSVGITLSDPRGSGPDDLLKDAATAMHRAQAKGTGYYEFFDQSMRVRVTNRLRLETDLRRGVERAEFRIHYQPIVSLSTGTITSFEARLLAGIIPLPVFA